MIMGYAGVSTQDQNAELQVDALEKKQGTTGFLGPETVTSHGSN